MRRELVASVMSPAGASARIPAASAPAGTPCKCGGEHVDSRSEAPCGTSSIIFWPAGACGSPARRGSGRPSRSGSRISPGATSCRGWRRAPPPGSRTGSGAASPAPRCRARGAGRGGAAGRGRRGGLVARALVGRPRRLRRRARARWCACAPASARRPRPAAVRARGALPLPARPRRRGARAPRRGPPAGAFDTSLALIARRQLAPGRRRATGPDGRGARARARSTRVFRHYGLQEIAKRDPARPLGLDNLAGRDPGAEAGQPARGSA